ncbi:MAG: hypothetical protein RSB71_00275 [Bacilli bacterium]
MKKNKKYIILIIILVIYALVAFILVPFAKRAKEPTLYMLLEPNTMWKLDHKKWSNVTNQNEFNFKKFDVFDGNKELGKYNLFYNEKWYILDDKRNKVKASNNIFATRSKVPIKVNDFSKQELNESDINLINEQLKSLSILGYDALKTSFKIEIDLDNDSYLDTIYGVSNVFVEEKHDKVFSLLFIKNKDKIQYLIKKISSVDKQIENICLPNVQNIIDLDRNKNVLLTNCNYFDLIGNCHAIFQLKNGQYEMIYSCGGGTYEIKI